MSPPVEPNLQFLISSAHLITPPLGEKTYGNVLGGSDCPATKSNSKNRKKASKTALFSTRNIGCKFHKKCSKTNDCRHSEGVPSCTRAGAENESFSLTPWLQPDVWGYPRSFLAVSMAYHFGQFPRRDLFVESIAHKPKPRRGDQFWSLIFAAFASLRLCVEVA